MQVTDQLHPEEETAQHEVAMQEDSQPEASEQEIPVQEVDQQEVAHQEEEMAPQVEDELVEKRAEDVEMVQD